MSRIALLALFAPATALAAPLPADSFRVEPSDPSAREPIDDFASALPIATAPRPDNEPQIVDDQRPLHLGSKILFVNFDGANMNACGGNDPHDNCSQIFNGTVLPYGGDSGNRAAIIQVARKRVEDFGITVTDHRPGSGDYDMEVVGNWQGSNPDFAGIAPAGDCWDNYGGETSFTLEISQSADAIAEVMMQELAHTWGLDHVDEQQDLLYPTTQGTNKTYRDECHQVVADTELNPTSGNCSHHQEACGTYSQQNSYAELMLIFGPSQPDTASPAVGIIAPADGAVIQGGAFDLEIGLQDDQLPAVINTTISIINSENPDLIPPADGAFASPAELSFPIEGLPNGTYTIRLDAQDESDNPASDEITITIEGSDAPTTDDGAADSEGGEAGSGDGGSDGAGGDGSADGNDDDGGSDDGSGSAADAGFTGEDRGGDPNGCACATDTSTPAGLAFAPLFVLLALRRRAR